MNIRQIIYESVSEGLLYEIHKSKIKQIVSEELMHCLYEKKNKKSKSDKKSNKSKGDKKDKKEHNPKDSDKDTRKKEAADFMNDPSTKKSAILYAALPDISKDGARSYGKYFDKSYKDYRNEVPEELVNKILNIKKNGL